MNKPPVQEDALPECGKRKDGPARQSPPSKQIAIEEDDYTQEQADRELRRNSNRDDEMEITSSFDSDASGDRLVREQDPVLISQSNLDVSMEMPDDYEFDDTPFESLEEHARTHRAVTEYREAIESLAWDNTHNNPHTAAATKNTEPEKGQNDDIQVDSPIQPPGNNPNEELEVEVQLEEPAVHPTTTTNEPTDSPRFASPDPLVNQENPQRDKSYK